MLNNAQGPPLQVPLGANRSSVWIYKSSLCSSAAFLSLDTVVSSVWKYWSEQNYDTSMGKREVFSYLLVKPWGRTFLKNSMLLLKGHWKIWPWGWFTDSTSSLVCVLRHEHKKCMSLLHVFVLKQLFGSCSSCSHLNFSFYGQNRKEKVYLCDIYSILLHCSPVMNGMPSVYYTGHKKCNVTENHLHLC